MVEDEAIGESGGRSEGRTGVFEGTKGTVKKTRKSGNRKRRCRFKSRFKRMEGDS